MTSPRVTPPWSGLTSAFKSAIDLTIAPLALLATSPVLLIAACWIRCVSPGPAIFRQVRIGRGERPFTIFKLRTMRLNAESHRNRSVTVRNDPRLIRGGLLIRALKIDELPQLLNVLNGSMSLVGPRPTVREDYNRMTPEQRRRAIVKPGITGLAQLRGGASIPWPQRIVFDLQYIDDYRLSRDLEILVETFFCTLMCRANNNPSIADEWESIPAP